MILAVLTVYTIGCIVTATFIQLNYTYFNLYSKLSTIFPILSLFDTLDNDNVQNEAGLFTIGFWPIVFILWWLLVPIFLIIITTPYVIISYLIERKDK